MTKRLFKVALSAVFAISMASCAQEEEYTISDIELRTVNDWVAKNRPDMEQVAEGLYMKLHKLSPTSTEIAYEGTNWVQYTYLCKTLDNNYCYNMYPEIANQLGFFNYTTHYTPEQTSIYSMTYSANAALTYAIPRMNPGDSVEMVGTSKYMYSGLIAAGSGESPSGYSGNRLLQENTPATINMKYNNFIANMNTYERAEVLKYAQDKLQLTEQDSVKDFSLMYIKKLVELPEADTVKLDSTVTINYTGRFIDGFVFDTNVIEIAKENHIYNSEKEYKPMDFIYNDSEFVAGFTQAIKLMKLGEKAEVVFTSNLGYASQGNTGATWIQANTPLVFNIEVIAPETDETE